MTWAPGWAASLRSGGAVLELRLRSRLPPYGVLAAIPHSRIVGPLTVDGLGLRLRSWSSAIGTLAARVAARSEAEADAWRAVPPGSVLEVWCRTSAGEERLWLGMLDSIATIAPGLLELAALDAVALSYSGLDSVGWRTGVCPAAGGASVVWSTYDPTTDTAIQVEPIGGTAAATAALLPDGASGTVAVAQVSGGPLVRYTGLSGATLTGVSVIHTPTGGTLASVAPTTPITFGCAVAGRPAQLALTLLRSGAGGYGGLDLGADAGLAIPAEWCDLGAPAAMDARYGPLSAPYVLAVLEPMQSPEGGILHQWLAGLGAWLCQRQGSLSVGGAVDPWTSTTWARRVGTVDDGLLLSVGRAETRHPDIVPFHRGVQVERATSATIGRSYRDAPDGARTAPAGWPSGEEYLQAANGTAACPAITSTWQTSGADVTAADAVGDLLAPYAARVVGSVDVTLTGEALAWAPGDVVEVITAAIPGAASGARAVWVPRQLDLLARRAAGTLLLVPEV